MIIRTQVRCAHNGNDGMLEYWNDGVASFGRINACGEKSHVETALVWNLEFVIWNFQASQGLPGYGAFADL